MIALKLVNKMDSFLLYVIDKNTNNNITDLNGKDVHISLFVQDLQYFEY